MTNNLVLVTGGSGFVGVHRVLQLLNAGYRVYTTLLAVTKFTIPRKFICFERIEGLLLLPFFVSDHAGSVLPEKSVLIP